jgi:hypothetical protein
VLLWWIIELRSVSSLFCNSLSYANSENTTCLSCPSYTARLLDDASTAAGPGSTLNDCVCLDGYYSTNGETGVACLACPPGAVCDGRSAPPRAKSGYWRAAPTTKFDKDKESDKWILLSPEATARENFLPCSPWYACISTEKSHFTMMESLTMTSDPHSAAVGLGNRNGTTKCDGARRGVRCEGSGGVHCLLCDMRHGTVFI